MHQGMPYDNSISFNVVTTKTQTLRESVAPLPKLIYT